MNVKLPFRGVDLSFDTPVSLVINHIQFIIVLISTFGTPFNLYHFFFNFYFDPAFPWSPMVFRGVVVFCDLPWYLVVSHGISWNFVIFRDVPWCLVIFGGSSNGNISQKYKEVQAEMHSFYFSNASMKDVTHDEFVPLLSDANANFLSIKSARVHALKSSKKAYFYE